MAIESRWVERWADRLTPVYFLVVVVPTNIEDWIRHPLDGTFHRAAGYWRRVQPNELGSSIVLDRTERLSVDTMDIWHADLLAAFAGPEGARK